MIRINLLPVRQIKKKLQARNNVISLGITLLSVLVVLGLVALVLGFKVGDLKASIGELNKEKNKYQKVIKEIENLKKDQGLLETKLDMISKLKSGSQLTVRLMDEMANLVPSERLWISKMTISKGVLKLSGTALDNATIADFMETVVASPYFATANLSGTSSKGVSGRILKTFSLTCKVVNPDVKEEKPPGQEQKGKTAKKKKK
jgi:type IV pilus assembly protein PilN